MQDSTMSFRLDTGKTKTRTNEHLSARVYGQIKQLILSESRFYLQRN